MHPQKPISAMHRFFAGLAEQTFQSRLGVADTAMIDYITGLLVRFVHQDSIYKVRSINGQQLRMVADMLAEAEARSGDSCREVHRHIGDFTLFWTGLYPEALQRMRSPVRKDHFIDYCTHGKRSYYIASTYRTEENEQESEVFQRLSMDFELCAYGLQEVRREWEQTSETEDGDLLID